MNAFNKRTARRIGAVSLLLALLASRYPGLSFAKTWNKALWRWRLKSRNDCWGISAPLP